MTRVNYRITELNGWLIVTPTGKAENNEPLRVKYLFRRWLSEKGARVIVNLKGLEQLGVWEVGVLTSFKREIDQRAGTLRLCHLDRTLAGYFQEDRFAEQFEIFSDLENAMAQTRNGKHGYPREDD
jgi:anti-anti-sigma regulatory factor